MACPLDGLDLDGLGLMPLPAEQHGGSPAPVNGSDRGTALREHATFFTYA
jgi:hypothetical protein